MAKKQQPKTQETQQQNSNQDEQNNNMVFLGGIWANRSQKTGEIYFSGYLGNAKVYLFKNKKKEKDTDPDFWMQVANQQKRNNEEIDLESELGDDIPF